MAQVLEINGVDFSGYVSKIAYEPTVILSEDSGRNARGDNAVDIVNRKDKITCHFLPMDQSTATALLNAVYNYVFEVKFLHPRTSTIRTMHAYVGQTQITLLNVYVSQNAYEETSLSFIEM